MTDACRVHRRRAVVNVWLLEAAPQQRVESTHCCLLAARNASGKADFDDKTANVEDGMRRCDCRMHATC